MRLFSWNVNGIRAVMKKWFPEILQKLNPDVIGLQEIKAKPEQIIAETDIIQSLGYECIFNSAERPGYSGTAVFTKVRPMYTWWSNFNNARANNSGWRIDYFLASQNIASRIVDATIHPDVMGSDHCPVSIVFN